MTPDEFVETVTTENETALSRLGSSKSLYADTGGDMEAGPMLAAAATAEFDAGETFERWADDEANEDAREAWADASADEREHFALVVDCLDGAERSDAGEFEPGETPRLHEYLRGVDDTVGRAGGFVGRTLASDRSKEQMTGFFVGQADPRTADLFRDLRDDLDDQLERALSILRDVREDDADRERAREAASGAIQAAYDEYTERLESMGVNPKPVC